MAENRAPNLGDRILKEEHTSRVANFRTNRVHTKCMRCHAFGAPVTHANMLMKHHRILHHTQESRAFLSRGVAAARITCGAWALLALLLELP